MRIFFNPPPQKKKIGLFFGYFRGLEWGIKKFSYLWIFWFQKKFWNLVTLLTLKNGVFFSKKSFWRYLKLASSPEFSLCKNFCPTASRVKLNGSLGLPSNKHKKNVIFSVFRDLKKKRSHIVNVYIFYGVLKNQCVIIF